MFIVLCFCTGLFIYFGYGIRHSNENKPLSAYNQILSYSGSGQDVTQPITKMADESVHMPQPSGESKVKMEQPEEDWYNGL